VQGRSRRYNFNVESLRAKSHVEYWVTEEVIIALGCDVSRSEPSKPGTTGQSRPVETVDATSIASCDLPRPGYPTSPVIFPRAMIPPDPTNPLRLDVRGAD
jgi:hypothetical protein